MKVLGSNCLLSLFCDSVAIASVQHSLQIVIEYILHVLPFTQRTVCLENDTIRNFLLYSHTYVLCVAAPAFLEISGIQLPENLTPDNETAIIVDKRDQG